MYDRKQHFSVAGALRALGMAAVALAAAGPARAQSGPSLELRGGFAVPAGDLNEVGEPGAGLGVGLGLPVHDRVTLRVDGDLEILGEENVEGTAMLPRTYLYHYHAGLEIDLLPTTSPWRVRLRGGAGGTTYDTDVLPGTGDDFLDTYFSAGGGVEVGRAVRQHVEVGVIGQSFFVFTDKDRTRELSDRSPLLNPFSKASSFPVQLYLRWRPR